MSNSQMRKELLSHYNGVLSRMGRDSLVNYIEGRLRNGYTPSAKILRKIAGEALQLALAAMSQESLEITYSEVFQPKYVCRCRCCGTVFTDSKDSYHDGKYAYCPECCHMTADRY